MSPFFRKRQEITDSKDLPAQPRDNKDKYLQKRLDMVSGQIENRGVHDHCVLQAMRKVPRHFFVNQEFWASAYADHPLDLPAEQSTISQPYIVARMTELLELRKEDRALEVGCGSGYQAAILAEIVSEVCAIERHENLVLRAQKTWQELGYGNIQARVGDGCRGWPEKAPFDAIIVTAYAHEPPSALLEQLATNGRLLIPIGYEGGQELVRFTKQADGNILREEFLACRFVPLISNLGSS